jgi:hypothetical protein
MKKKKLLNFFLLVVFVLSFTAIIPAQTKSLIKRTTYKTDNLEFEAGDTISIVGAPNGSVSVEGWQKNEVEISADIEVQAETEMDLTRLAQVNGFVLDKNFRHLSIISVGTHDKNYLKRIAGKLPKNLLLMPFKVDYRIKVPSFCRLEIDGGQGDLQISKIIGAMRINFLRSNAKLDLEGGIITATFGSGSVDVSVNSRVLPKSNFDVQMADGTINVELTNNIDAEFSGKILRTGRIENASNLLKPPTRAKSTEKSIAARVGKGGGRLSFVVGDGTIKIQDSKLSNEQLEK